MEWQQQQHTSKIDNNKIWFHRNGTISYSIRELNCPTVFNVTIKVSVCVLIAIVVHCQSGRMTPRCVCVWLLRGCLSACVMCCANAQSAERILVWKPNNGVATGSWDRIKFAWFMGIFETKWQWIAISTVWWSRSQDDSAVDTTQKTAIDIENREIAIMVISFVRAENSPHATNSKYT